MAIKIFENKKIVYGLMTLLVFMWGFEYVAAKTALEELQPLTLVFYKYLTAVIGHFFVRLFQKKRFPLKKKHILTLICCSLLGEILYFACEYTAMDYLPVSIISIVLAFVPMLSIILEIFIKKRYPNVIIIIGIFVCIGGVSMIIGVDFSEMLSGQWIGYVLAFGAVVFWNGYNFLTERLSEEYEAYDVTFMQLSCTVLLTLPYAIFNTPDVSQVDPSVFAGVLYLGIASAGLGFLIYVTGISVIGPTPCALFSNFLPITTAIFGWIFLGERLTSFQMMGGLVVIVSGALVIWQKGKLDLKYEKLKEPQNE